MEACGTVTQSCGFQAGQQLAAMLPREQGTRFPSLSGTCVWGAYSDRVR